MAVNAATPMTIGITAASGRWSLESMSDMHVWTEPNGESQAGDPGIMVGAMSSAKFYATIRSEVFIPTGGTPPSTIGFRLTRPAKSSIEYKKGFLITDQTDLWDPPVSVAGGTIWTYRTYMVPLEEGITDWILTEEKGRWEAKVAQHDSDTAEYKIDKREQIVQVADSWVGSSTPSGMCNDFVSMVYNRLGFPDLLDSSADAQHSLLQSQELSSVGRGSLAFYRRWDTVNWDPPTGACHVGIKYDDQVIDINCDDPPDNTVVDKHSVVKDVRDQGNPDGGYNMDIHYRTLQEILDLDGE